MDEEASRAGMRVGDRERRDVDTWLQRAHGDGVLTLTEYEERSAQCWAARTRGELDALVADLPEPSPAPEEPGTAPVPVDRPRRRSALRRRAIGAAAAAVAVFGAVQVAASTDAGAVFGSRVVQVAADQDSVDVGVLFGSVQVVVPPDARVTTRGVILFGSTDCNAACNGSGTRAVTVSGSGGFGSVDIVRPGEQQARGHDRDDDD